AECVKKALSISMCQDLLTRLLLCRMILFSFVAPMPDRKLEVVPIGGLGEFGMNSMALRYGDDIIVIDAGMMFPESELLGVDIVTPDFTYLEQHAAMVRALILTHGHEDHIG